MLYIYLDTNTIKLMFLKKSILGQYDASFYNKTLQVPLLEKGQPANPDVIASGIKETLAMLPEGVGKEKDVTLILPQESFMFMRTDMPSDVAENVLGTYLKEKARTELTFDVESGHYDYIVRENEGQKKIVFYAASNETVESFAQPLKLIDLTLQGIIPESLTYFKLFEKTLRTNKKENIWYVSYDQDQLSGYIYDSFGLLEGEHWTAKTTADKKIEKILQKKASEYQTKYTKLNRLILSGGQSETVRQDTFTKDVGVWTNPLKRIIPHFYGDYLKMLSGQENKEIPLLEYDMLLGAFIFSTENKAFTLMNNKGGGSSASKFAKSSLPMPKAKLPMKGILFFVLSFAVTFAILYGFKMLSSKNLSFKMPSFNIAIPGLAQPTPTAVPATPTPMPPTPTPTPAIDRAEVRIQVLNGSGIAGKASDVKEFLREQGYEEILTGNASAFDYETTVIQTKEGDETLRDLITDDIASELEGDVEYETLEDDDAADVVIIVGTDFR